MIYKAFSSDRKELSYIEIISTNDKITFSILDDDGVQGIISIFAYDFIKILIGMAANNDIKGADIVVTHEREKE